MIGQGVFDRFPNVRLVLEGFGIAWLPSLLWSMDQFWLSPYSAAFHRRFLLHGAGWHFRSDA